MENEYIISEPSIEKVQKAQKQIKADLKAGKKFVAVVEPHEALVKEKNHLWFRQVAHLQAAVRKALIGYSFEIGSNKSLTIEDLDDDGRENVKKRVEEIMGGN